MNEEIKNEEIEEVSTIVVDEPENENKGVVYAVTAAAIGAIGIGITCVAKACKKKKKAKDANKSDDAEATANAIKLLEDIGYTVEAPGTSEDSEEENEEDKK